MGSGTELGRSLGEGNANPLQYSCPENSTDRGTWWSTVHGVAKSWTRLSTHTHVYMCIYMYMYIYIHTCVCVCVCVCVYLRVLTPWIQNEYAWESNSI